MTESITGAVIPVADFHLIHSENAFGKTLRLSFKQYGTELLLLQPFNAWAEKHWYSGQHDESNHRALAIMLHEAYERGRTSKLSEIQKILGIR